MGKYGVLAGSEGGSWVWVVPVVLRVYDLFSLRLSGGFLFHFFTLFMLYF